MTQKPQPLKQPKTRYQLLQFETQTACNGNCTFCMHPQMTRKGRMSLSNIIDLSYHLARYAQVVCPFHMQEPLLDNRLDKICSNVKQFHPTGKLHLFTNMSIYPEKMLTNLVKWVAVDKWIISCYGFDRETHEKLQPGVSFKQITQNIKKFVKLRNKYGFYNPRIALGYLVTPDTYPVKKRFYKYWSNIVDRIELYRYDGWCGNKPYDTEFEESVWGKPAPRVPCKELYIGPYIHYNGNVVPCCLDFNDKHVLGNVFKDGYDVWPKSSSLLMMRMLHEKGRWDDISMCRECTKYRYQHPQEWINYWTKQKPSLVKSAIKQ